MDKSTNAAVSFAGLMLDARVPAAPARRIQARRSSIHGRGLFAAADIDQGAFILEYKGERLSMAQAARLWRRGGQQTHTFLWGLQDGSVIDGGRGGNSSRWLNHSCSPNVQAQESDDGRVRFFALRDIRAGEELFIDYALVYDGRITAAVKRTYACFCGSDACRATMLQLRSRRSSSVALET